MQLKLKCNLCEEILLEYSLFKHMRQKHGFDRGGAMYTMFKNGAAIHVAVKDTISIAVNKQNMCELIWRFLLLECSEIAKLLTAPTYGLWLINETTMMKLSYELEFRKNSNF